MTKVKLNASWNGLSPKQRRTLESWLFDEKLGYQEALERARKELGFKGAMSSLRRFYSRPSQERLGGWMNQQWWKKVEKTVLEGGWRRVLVKNGCAQLHVFTRIYRILHNVPLVNVTSDKSQGRSARIAGLGMTKSWFWIQSAAFYGGGCRKGKERHEFGFPSPPRDGCPRGVVRYRETWSQMNANLIRKTGTGILTTNHAKHTKRKDRPTPLPPSRAR